MKVNPKIAYFVSSHGFGHATRTVAILNEIHSIDKSVEFLLVSDLNEAFWKQNLTSSINFKNYRTQTDIGIVQKDPFRYDLEETIQSLSKFLKSTDIGHEHLAQTLNSMGVKKVISDISPLGVVIANRLKIPSILVENFTWDWIYESLTSEKKEFLLISKQVKRIYESVALRIQMKPFCKKNDRAFQVNPVHRQFRQSPSTIKSKLGIDPSESFTLISTGGISYKYQFLQKLEQSSRNFVISGNFKKITKSNNLVFLPIDSNLYYPDLVRSSNQVVSKVGYGTAVECWAAGKKLLGIFRDNFRESNVLRKFLKSEGLVHEITLENFDNGDWIQEINKLDGLTPVNREGKNNGNRTAAQKILEYPSI